MSIEVKVVGRPRVPRYFPPGYFDWAFWMAVGINAAGTAYVAWAAFWITGTGAPDGWLFVQCGCFALNLYTAGRFVRRVARDSREWRTVDRARFEAAIAEAEKDMARMAKEFAEFMAQRERNGNQN